MLTENPKLLRMRRRDDRGAAAVEFALIVPVLILFLFGILQFGMIFLMEHGLTEAAADAARSAAAAPQSTASTLAYNQLSGYVNSDTGSLITAPCSTVTGAALQCTATVAQCANQAPGFNCLTVTVKYSHKNDPSAVAPDLLAVLGIPYPTTLTQSSTVLLSGSLS